MYILCISNVHSKFNFKPANYDFPQKLYTKYFVGERIQSVEGSKSVRFLNAELDILVPNLIIKADRDIEWHSEIMKHKITLMKFY